MAKQTISPQLVIDIAIGFMVRYDVYEFTTLDFIKYIQDNFFMNEDNQLELETGIALAVNDLVKNKDKNGVLYYFNIDDDGKWTPKA